MSLLKTNIKKENGVYYLTQKRNDFSNLYIQVRDLEKRVYADQIVKQLPSVSKNHHYYDEWKLRQKSTQRIITYLKNLNRPIKILDLGCGNGWFSYQLSLIPDSEVLGVDVNDIELEQAVRVFDKPNLHFIYADIFSEGVEILEDFDIVTVNSCIQYFEDLEHILSRLKSLLKEQGELHLLDSPFYKLNEIEPARKRTITYYQKLGVPEMVNHYFHHSFNKISEFEILYKHKKSILNKILGKKDSPFMWYRFIKKTKTTVV
ncbi:methyltransferase domain-containing protein [Aquimarina sp. MMG016]|uniref:class I SAM-dependent methyltransferase n=1 Tax=Aquimarina sp. MMG016 TaxID=2822690 RepID=UPI001B3A3B79|nr:methyltransferase domain-containing protein [Aquimarina sp. MMG016]MBQ4821770.1 methyltransferase domain-containing protein [Aquimarina sp. MMG016]